MVDELNRADERTNGDADLRNGNRLKWSVGFYTPSMIYLYFRFRFRFRFVEREGRDRFRFLLRGTA